jgi:hypothetical protein
MLSPMIRRAALLWQIRLTQTVAATQVYCAAGTVAPSASLVGFGASLAAADYYSYVSAAPAYIYDPATFALTTSTVDGSLRMQTTFRSQRSTRIARSQRCTSTKCLIHLLLWSRLRQPT